MEQYKSFAIPPTQRFDVTLHLCVLQLLLANRIELAIATNNAVDKKQWLEPLQPFVHRLVAEPGAIEQNTPTTNVPRRSGLSRATAAAKTC